MKICLILLAVVPVAAAPLYTLTNIGGVGGSLSEAFAISVGGAVAGTAIDVQGRSHGFAYESFTSAYESGTEARGVASDGAVVGTRDGYATVWRGGSAESLGSLGGAGSSGLAISDAGHVTGSALRSDGRMHAYVYFGGRMVNAGTLGGSWSAGYGVNSAG